MFQAFLQQAWETVNNCSFPGLSQKTRPLRRPVPSQVLEIRSCTLHRLWSGLLSRSPTVQIEWVSGQKQAWPHAGKHKQITPQSPFLVKGSANLRVSGQEEYHQTNGSCVCSTMKHEQRMSPGGFTVACPKETDMGEWVGMGQCSYFRVIPTAPGERASFRIPPPPPPPPATRKDLGACHFWINCLYLFETGRDDSTCVCFLLMLNRCTGLLQPHGYSSR